MYSEAIHLPKPSQLTKIALTGAAILASIFILRNSGWAVYNIRRALEDSYTPQKTQQETQDLQQSQQTPQNSKTYMTYNKKYSE